MVNTATPSNRKKRDSLLSFAKGSNLILIGFMGSGKSSVARILAKESGHLWVDTDSLLELREGMSVAQIFEQHKEEGFRALERELASQMRHSLQETIISTGGGMPLFCDLSSLGKLFFLDLPFEAILERLSKEERAKRPLLNDLSKAKALFDQRRSSYLHLANHTLQADQSPLKVAQEILSLL